MFGNLNLFLPFVLKLKKAIKVYLCQNTLMVQNNSFQLQHNFFRQTTLHSSNHKIIFEVLTFPGTHIMPCVTKSKCFELNHLSSPKQLILLIQDLKYAPVSLENLNLNSVSISELRKVTRCFQLEHLMTQNDSFKLKHKFSTRPHSYESNSALISQKCQS